jgi:tRNA (guanine-N7-)-methyltransferase
VSDSDTTRRLRPVRSFVRREGRLTDGQQRALDELLPRYGVEPDGDAPLDFRSLFGNEAPVVLDIGFGDGAALAALAAAQPQRSFLGAEVYRPGIGRLLRQLEEEGIGNVRVVCGDAVELLRRNIPDASLGGLNLFFPDPWPKKRHHKRRMVQPEWLTLVARKLGPGGILHLATDWQDYAEHMLAVTDACAELDNPAGRGRYAPDPGDRPQTKFERRGRSKGHGVWDLILQRRD